MSPQRSPAALSNPGAVQTRLYLYTDAELGVPLGVGNVLALPVGFFVTVGKVLLPPPDRAGHLCGHLPTSRGLGRVGRGNGECPRRLLGGHGAPFPALNRARYETCEARLAWKAAL